MSVWKIEGKRFAWRGGIELLPGSTEKTPVGGKEKLFHLLLLLLLEISIDLERW